MADSEVAICNQALVILGGALITAVTDDVKNARTLSAIYAATRDSELRLRRWKFSIKRTSLPALAAAPDSDYSYQYQLPNDYLRLIEGGDIAPTADMSDYRATSGTALYSIENGLLLTNLPSPVSIRYVARITDTTKFDAAFDASLAAQLAYLACEAITGSDQKQQLAMIRKKDAVRSALRANALEAPPQPSADDTWIAGRLMQ